MLLLGFSANSSDQSPIYTATSSNETFFEFPTNETKIMGQQNESGQPSVSVDDKSTNFFTYLPLCAIILAAIGYHIGLSPITWSYMGKY